MIRKRVFLALSVVLALSACEDDLMIENFNSEDLDNLIRNPTRASVQSATTGLLVGGRLEIDDGNGYVSLTGILGRESYNFDASDPRFVIEMLEQPMDPGSRAFGGNIWSERYSNIRLGNIVLAAVELLGTAPTGETPTALQFSAEEKEAIRGFVKTMQAHEFLLVINTRDVNGAVVDVDRDPRGDPGPIVAKAEVLAHIAALLDEARDHLDDAGGSFPFALTSGFVGFETPPSFRTFNRALAARVEAYRASPDCAGCGGDWAAVLIELGESFVNPGAPLDLGVYHVFSFISGDETSPGNSPGNDLSPQIQLLNILAHPSIATDVEMQANGEPDLRFQNKVRQLAAPRSRAGLSSEYTFTHYDNPLSPIPIIRNEELILLRAEARFRTGAIGLAEDDINLIREESGGLDRIDLTGVTDDEFNDRILFERRYSLMFEGGHRWIDARRLNRLEDLPIDLPTHVLNAAFPIPEEDCLARGLEGSPGGGCV
jgi:hypothetical protein